MATTKNNKVGYVRKKLAIMLEEALEKQGFKAAIDPAGLNSQFPYWVSRAGACSWSGYGLHETENLKGLTINFCSWDTMGSCVKSGLIVAAGECGGPPFNFEVHAK